ncbi:SGNH/GDSL hydrolase family protein [Methylobacterium sp. J-076]|uniref:SGNH/GDSL hydrolase family protein n=1 Tax=Methylobacterium sp. J-076 TaxID=2836655 RepID=UPI001FBB49D5|nr:SGNH/GDSL hydrolase family protein [Methylobacterium sp. J-076]MCJ2013032.1 SGNH/GDSL hydrolase family protein [Methylobacterium sp. J-076]
MRRWIAPAVAALLMLGAGGVLGWNLRKPAADARAYAGMRLVAVQVALDEAPAAYIFLAGDSQSELQPADQRPCGLPLVNGGVSGATAAAYAEHLSRLAFPVHPQAASLTIGTNDILLKNRPRGVDAAARFEAAAERIVRGLQGVTGRVVVTALPPVGREIAALVDAGAVGDYSDRLKALCGRLGCAFTDPYADLRDGDTGFAKPGALRDGLHLARFRPAMQALTPALCGG